MEAIKKAYKIDLDKLDEGYMSESKWCHAESLNKAKQKLLKQVNGYELRSTGDTVTYLNIPVVRHFEGDLFEHEGKLLTLHGIALFKLEVERKQKLDAIMADDSIEFCYIKKGSYYRPHSCGYTSMITQAGVYTKQIAVSEARSVSEIQVIPINIISHNKTLNEEIADLQSRILQRKMI